MSYSDPQSNFERRHMNDNRASQLNYTPPIVDRSPYPKERSGWLSALLIFIFGLNAFFIFMLFDAATKAGNTNFRFYGSSADEVFPLLAISFAVTCVQMACVVALWNYRRWGYYGLLIGYVLAFFMNVLSGAFPTAIGNLVFLGLVFALVNPIDNVLD